MKRCAQSYLQNQDANESETWTPEEMIDPKKRRLMLSSVSRQNGPLKLNGAANWSNAIFGTDSNRKETPGAPSLKERMDAVVQNDPIREERAYESGALSKTIVTKKQNLYQVKEVADFVPAPQTKALVSSTDSTLTAANIQLGDKTAISTVFDAVLTQSRKDGCEFDTLCALALTCKSFAAIYALSAKASIALVKRYIDAYMRERVTVRKFEIENTPTKLSLEPYYQFREEKDEQQDEDTETERHWSRTTFTLTAPCISVCWKGIDGVPPVSLSRSPAAAWADHCDQSALWERVKTKNWSIRNPLVRLVAIHAQAHAACTHSYRINEWLKRVKKDWPLAKQRKPWKEHAQWHDRPILQCALPESNRKQNAKK